MILETSATPLDLFLTPFALCLYIYTLNCLMMDSNKDEKMSEKVLLIEKQNKAAILTLNKTDNSKCLEYRNPGRHHSGLPGTAQ